MSNKEQWVTIIEDLQYNICMSLEQCDGRSVFIEDIWKREGGGGGKTRVISNGNIFEKGGVNTSIVFGPLTENMRAQLNIPSLAGGSWFAAGISIVLHPVNPFVPTIHCNYRMFELYDANNLLTNQWFGGGTDLTPCYLFNEDAFHFHGTYKKICDAFDPDFYPLFKKNCDDYFVNYHRDNERRGIGGIFYDYQKPSEIKPAGSWMDFGKACGSAFLTAYLPIVEKRKDTPYDESNLHWQEIRRGRYVEFNLVYDRGTLFGLKTNGRTESILMSLPPRVRFEYNYQPEPGSEEDRLLQVCLQPRDWI
ncbi:MAG TPA: oxygen-dependent coproporphyrinogen oxidase [Ferruginibacter sp.]|nr:oxygen-dependent coproporphyrinogen oxidase [Ferruginibacter sp.]